jgi:hypothetical protein
VISEISRRKSAATSATGSAKPAGVRDRLRAPATPPRDNAYRKTVFVVVFYRTVV